MLDEEQYLTLKRMQQDADELSSWCLWTGETHGHRERRMRRVETTLVWLTAVSAGLSCLSLLTNITGVTIALSLLTVLFAGSNLALKPSQRSSDHRDHAAALTSVGERFWVLARYRLPSVSSSKMTKREFNQLVTDYEAIDQERVAVLARAPYIEPFRTPQESLGD